MSSRLDGAGVGLGSNAVHLNHMRGLEPLKEDEKRTEPSVEDRNEIPSEMEQNQRGSGRTLRENCSVCDENVEQGRDDREVGKREDNMRMLKGRESKRREETACPTLFRISASAPDDPSDWSPPAIIMA